MSDPVSNAEIEDVLSSIRRLVSEGGRTPEKNSAGALKVDRKIEKSAAPEAEDRLVLTPALRVPDASELEVESVESPNESSDSEVVEAAVELVEDPLEETEATEAPPLMFNHAEFVVEAEEDTVEEGAVSETEMTTEEVSEIEAELQDDGFAMPNPDSRILRWENVSTTDGTPYEPDEPGDSDYAGTNIESLTWQSRDDEALSDTEEMAQQIEAEAVAYATQGIEESFADAGAANQLDDAFTMDEAMLREMVADIVRQELQGALGERITRNVRKLVRREIHRALAAHDLG